MDAPQPGNMTGSKDKTQQDLLTGGILFAAALLFVFNGSEAIGQVIAAFAGLGAGVEEVLTIAVLLNVALILFGYRRYRDLQKEVSHRAAAEQRASTLASIDPLTNFFNRRSFQEKCTAMIHDAGRSGKTVAIMLLDLDHFKTINDIHGHEAGDVVLKIVAERMSKILPPSSIAARLGGDEFTCACTFDDGQGEMIERIA